MITSTVQNIMTRNIISVNPETPLLEAYDLMAKHNFSGLPVIDTNGVLQGIITEYDLIVKGSFVHLPTFQKILQELPVFKKDRNRFHKEMEELHKLKVKNLMNAEPLILLEDASFEEVITTFRDHHRVNPIPVINKENKVIGIVSRYDVLKLFNIYGDRKKS